MQMLRHVCPSYDCFSLQWTWQAELQLDACALSNPTTLQTAARLMGLLNIWTSLCQNAVCTTVNCSPRNAAPAEERRVIESLVQLLGKRGGLEEPLLERPPLHFGPRPPRPALCVHLLVRQHSLVHRVPVDHGPPLVGQPALQQPQEEVLRPPVVGRVARRDFSVPIKSAVKAG